jgi:[NiFe] hydrogenase small subunit
MEHEKNAKQQLEQRGISRRDFMKYCTLLSATMGLSSSFIPKIAEAFANGQRLPVLYLSFSECTGCTESVIRTMYPWIDTLLLDIISLDYQETLMAPSGEAAEKSLHDTVTRYPGQFICVVSGAIPTAEQGRHGRINGETFLDIAKEVCPKALATIAIGTCASYGGIQAAAPNPTAAKSVNDAIGINTLNIAGCPPNPVNFVGTVVNYLLFGRFPEVDDKGRPLFAYGKTIHDQCQRRCHFENGEFVTSFGSEEAKRGYCLYQVGCKGPATYNNCPLVRFNDGTSWPVQGGHPCIGCSEPNFWDRMSPFYSSL